MTWTCTQYDKVYNLANFGNVEQRNQIEQDGKITSSLIDGFGWGVGSLDQDLNLTRTKFDESGNPKEVIDALLQTTSYVYDELGRQTSMTNFAGTTKTNYDPANGRILSREDGKQQLTYYFYDDLGRQTKVTDRLAQDTNSNVRCGRSAGNPN